MLIQYHQRINAALILSCDHCHSLLLTVDETDRIAVKSGFASGYGGEGPKALGRVLRLLLSHKIDVDEINVEQALMDRLDASALTEKDMDKIASARTVRPMRLYDYMYDVGISFQGKGDQWDSFPPVMPFAIIDKRIEDLALRFHSEPNDTLLQGYRRLEDTIRRRITSEEHGAKLFSQAFQGEGAKLAWKDVQPSEVVGRVNLFTGAYMAHRNPRAHRETSTSIHSLLSEFLLLNHLFDLERAASAPEGSART